MNGETKFTAAVVQAAPIAFDREATLDKAERLVAEAATGARLVVFPEAFVSCYPRGLNFGAVVGNFFQGDDTATRGIRYNGPMTSLRGTCYANAFANYTGHAIVDSAGEPIANGFTAGPGGAIWPEFKADGNVVWT